MEFDKGYKAQRKLLFSRWNQFLSLIRSLFSVHVKVCLLVPQSQKKNNNKKQKNNNKTTNKQQTKKQKTKTEGKSRNPSSFIEHSTPNFCLVWGLRSVSPRHYLNSRSLITSARPISCCTKHTGKRC